MTEPIQEKAGITGPGDFGNATKSKDPTPPRTGAQQDAFGSTPRKFYVVATRPGKLRTVVFTSLSSSEAQSAADAHRCFALATGADVGNSVERGGLQAAVVERGRR